MAQLFIIMQRPHDGPPCLLQGGGNTPLLHQCAKKGTGKLKPGAVKNRLSHADNVGNAFVGKPLHQPVVQTGRGGFAGVTCRENHRLNSCAGKCRCKPLFINQFAAIVVTLEQEVPSVVVRVQVIFMELAMAAEIDKVRPEVVQLMGKLTESPVIRHFKQHVAALPPLAKRLQHQRLLILNAKLLFFPNVIRQCGKEQHPQWPIFNGWQLCAGGGNGSRQGKALTAAKKTRLGMVERFPRKVQNLRFTALNDNGQKMLPCPLSGLLEWLVSIERTPQEGSNCLQSVVGHKFFLIGIDIRKLGGQFHQLRVAGEDAFVRPEYEWVNHSGNRLLWQRGI